MFICIRWNLDLDSNCCVRCVVQGRVIHTTRGFFSRRSSFNLSVPAFDRRSHSSDCIARHVHQATSLLHSTSCQKYNRHQQNRLDHNGSFASKDRSLHHQDSQLTKWGIWRNVSQSLLDVLSELTTDSAMLFESVVCCVVSSAGSAVNVWNDCFYCEQNTFIRHISRFFLHS